MPMAEHYTDMKDSGVEWIGEMPAHWQLLRGKWLMQLLSRPVSEGDDIITCFRDGEVTLRKKRREDGFTIAEKEIGYQGIEPGDLVVHGMDGFAGAIGISDSRGKATPVLLVLDSTQNKQYLMYYLRSMAYCDVYMGISSGIRIRSCALNWNKLANLNFPVPPFSEQTRITTYLNKKLFEIQVSISEGKASIEDYKLLKQSIITKAVTKGLDPTVEMKDSGVEWIGKIPVHWETAPIKRVFDSTHGSAIRVGPFGSALSGSDYQSEGVWVYNQRSVLDNNFSTNDTFVTAQKAEQLKGFAVIPGDLLITTRGSIGKIAIVPQNAPAGILHPCIIRFRIDSSAMDAKLISYMFNECDFIRQQILFRSNSTTIDVLYSYTLKELIITLPPKDEQSKILNYIDQQCAFFDSLISTKQALIADLEAYKKSLIYEVVTGKRRV